MLLAKISNERTACREKRELSNANKIQLSTRIKQTLFYRSWKLSFICVWNLSLSLYAVLSALIFASSTQQFVNDITARRNVCQNGVARVNDLWSRFAFVKIWTDKVKRETRFDSQQKIHTLKVTKESRRKKKNCRMAGRLSPTSLEPWVVFYMGTLWVIYMIRHTYRAKQLDRSITSYCKLHREARTAQRKYDRHQNRRLLENFKHLPICFST